MQESLAEADDLAIAAINLSRRRYAPEPPDPVTVAFAGHVAFRWWQQVRSIFPSSIMQTGLTPTVLITGRLTY